MGLCLALILLEALAESARHKPASNETAISPEISLNFGNTINSTANPNPGHKNSATKHNPKSGNKKTCALPKGKPEVF